MAITTKSGLPTLNSGVLNNGPLSGGYEAQTCHINTDGTVATSSTKSGSAYFSKYGWLRNPDGTIVVSSIKQAGAYMAKCGVLVNPDGSAVVTTAQTNPYMSSIGVLVN